MSDFKITSSEIIYLWNNNFSISSIVNRYYSKYKNIYTKKQIREKVEEILYTDLSKTFF